MENEEQDRTDRNLQMYLIGGGIAATFFVVRGKIRRYLREKEARERSERRAEATRLAFEEQMKKTAESREKTKQAEAEIMKQLSEKYGVPLPEEFKDS